MNNFVKHIHDQTGSVIVLAMIMLALLTLIGISSINTSSTGGQLAVAKQYNEIEFYMADSGWKQGAMWLENQAAAPIWVNSANVFVKNYGHETAADVDTSTPKTITPDNNSLSYYSVPYWYGIEHLDSSSFEGGGFAAGNEKGYERMFYEITSKANMLKEDVGVTSQEIKVRTSKLYKVGY